MANFTRLAREIWRDYVSDGLPDTGPNQPKKADIRKWGLDLETAIDDTQRIAQSGVRPVLTAVRLLVTTDVSPATGMAAGSTFDGVVLVAGWRIAKAYNGATGAATNGIYVVPVTGAAARATDADTSDELINGCFRVTHGTHAGEQWGVRNVTAITVGTTAIVIDMTAPADGTTGEVTDARTAPQGAYATLGDRLDDLQAGAYDLPPGLGYEAAAVGGNGGIRSGVAADGTGILPLGLDSVFDGFCHVTDANGVQQIALVNEFGTRIMTRGPGNKFKGPHHGPDAVRFTRSNVPAGEPVEGIVTKRWNTVTASAPYTAPVVRIVFTYGQSLAFGTVGSSQAYVINSSPPEPDKLFCFERHINPRSNFTNATIASGGLGALVPAVESMYGGPPGGTGESLSLAFGLGVLEAHDHSGPVIVFGAGLGGTALVNLLPGTTPYNNAIACIQIAKDLATAKWPGCAVQVAAINLEHGQSDYFTASATYQTQMGTLFAGFDADIATITGQATPALKIVGQNRVFNTGPLRGADIAIFDYAVANPSVLWRQPPYTGRFDDAYHPKSPAYMPRGSMAAHAYESWVRESQRPLLMIEGTPVRTGNYIDGAFVNLPTKLMIDPTIVDDGTLGFSFGDNNTLIDSDNTAVVRSAKLTGDRTFRVYLSATPTGTAKQLRIAWSDYANASGVPSRRIGPRTPLCIASDATCPFTGEPLLIRPAGQAVSIA